MVFGIPPFEDESHYGNMLPRLQYARSLDGQALKSSTRDADIYIFI